MSPDGLKCCHAGGVSMAQFRGVVKSFNEQKGYGFIESADTAAIYGKDVFVLKTALQGAFPGDQVTFSVVDSHKGPQAENILVLNRRPMAAAARPQGPYGQTVGPRPMGGPFRGPVPARAPMNGKGGGCAPADNIGIVKSFNALKGWGFITSDEIMQTFGKDLFFMKSSLSAPVSEGQQVYFTIFESPKGTQAQNIQPVASNRMPAAFRSQTPVPAPSAYRPAMPVRPMHAAPMHAAPMHAAPMAAMHAYSPMPSTQPVHNEYFFGAVKGYNEEKGWGHITCQVAKDRFGKEVFLLRSALNGQAVEPGTLVGFTVNMSPKGPQANEVVVLPSDTFSFEGQPGRRYAASVNRLLRRAPRSAPWLQRCSATESYGRRAELYDEDVFDPIDELPLTRRRRGGIGWSLAEKTEKPLEAVEEKPVELVEDPKILDPKVVEIDPELERPSNNAREASGASGKGVKLGVRPPPPPPLGRPRSVEVSTPKEVILGPAGNGEVDDFLQKHGVVLEGTAELKPIRSFEEGGFPEQVLDYLKSAGFCQPTPIQSVAWPLALSGSDLVGLAETGSGKTLAYLLPGMMHVKSQPPVEVGDGPIALVLAPTRELVMQIQWEAFRLGELLGLRDAVCYGGVPRRGQQQELRRGVELLIATPGRLLDFVNAKVTNLDRVTYLVVDEADRMLDMGFEPQLRQVVSKLKAERQTLLWQFFEWLQEVSPQNLRPRILIFTETKKGADALCRELRYEQFEVGAIHGDKDQGERDAILNNFRKGKCQILVATDVAQRGLDIKDVEYVVNYHMPNTIEDYVHRIGRTGRAGKSGTAVSFFGCDFRSNDKVRFAKRLVKVMQDAGQDPPDALLRLAETGAAVNELFKNCLQATIRLFHQDKGWGFVTSEEITGLFFGKDIFLHGKQLNDSSVTPHAGDEAHFSIEIAENGKLQAREVDVFPAGHEEENFEPVRRPAMTMRSAPY
eukprot:s2297_g5.t2